MPFNRREPTPTPTRSSSTAPQNDLLRLGGLYPSKSGKALTGNIRLSYVRKGSTESIGVELIDLIQQCMEEQQDLRVLVFESNGKFAGPPYLLNATMSQPRVTQEATVPETVAEESDPEPEAETPPPPPLPTTPSRPIRRVAPRR